MNRHLYHIEDVYHSIAAEEPLMAQLSGWYASPDLAIAQISGRDSVAAVSLSLGSGTISRVFPVADKLPNLEGDWSVISGNVEWLQQRYPGRVLDLVVFTHGRLYQDLTDLSQRILQTPCVGCHLYFHVYPIPILRALGRTKVISGARESHDGKLKINQLPYALDCYQRIVHGLGGQLLLPVRRLTRCQEVVDVLDEAAIFTAQSPQLHCDPAFGVKPPIGRPDEKDRELEAFFEHAPPLIDDYFAIECRLENQGS